MRFHTAKRRPPVIQIVSLIDILAILLIFFIVTTTFKRDEPQLNIALPPSKTAEPIPADTEPILLLVAKDGRVAIGETYYDTPESLVAALIELKAAGQESLVAMKADEGAPFGAIIRVIDALQEANYSNLPTFAKPPED